MPVFPAVGSTMVEPGRRRPRFSASWIMPSAARSLTLPPGFRNSSFAKIDALRGRSKERRCRIGVSPIRSRADAHTCSLDTRHPSVVVVRIAVRAVLLGVSLALAVAFATGVVPAGLLLPGIPSAVLLGDVMLDLHTPAPLRYDGVRAD